MSIRVQEQSTNTISVKRGVGQGDVISAKLFTSTLEDAFKLLEWKDLGIDINGEYIKSAELLEDLEQKLVDLNSVSQKVR